MKMKMIGFFFCSSRAPFSQLQNEGLQKPYSNSTYIHCITFDSTKFHILRLYIYILYNIKMKRRSRMQIISLLCVCQSMMTHAFMSPSTTFGHANIRHNIFDVRPMRENSHGIYHKRIKYSHGRHRGNNMQLSATHDFLSSISVALSDPTSITCSR